MNLSVGLTRPEIRRITRIINKSVDAPLNFLRWLMLLVALAPPVYTLATHLGELDGALVWRAVYTYPVLYIGFGLFVLLSAPILRLLGYDGTLRVGGRVLTEQASEYYIDPNGVYRYQNGQLVAAYSYGAAAEVHRTGGMILLLQQNLLLAAFPERCFANGAEADRLDTMLRNGVAYARGGYTLPLASAPQDCLWRFQYPFDASLALAANAQVRKARPGKRFVKTAGWATMLALLVVLLAGFTAFLVPRLMEGDFSSTSPFLFYLVWVPAFGVALARNPAKMMDSHSLPPYVYGNSTLEVRTGGVRVYNGQYEEVYAWQELTGLLGGSGFSLLMRRSEIAAALPYSAAPPEVLQQCLEYANQNAGRTPVPYGGPVPPAAPPAPLA